MKYSLVALGIVVFGLIAGGTWWIVNSADSAEETSNTTAEENQETTTETEASDEATASVTIAYSDDGFSTSADSIQAGGTVLVVNESNETLEFSSDPHPQHTDNSELNLPVLEPGEQETMVVDKVGEWGFHNHLNDDHSGSITVTD